MHFMNVVKCTTTFLVAISVGPFLFAALLALLALSLTWH
jgi:hypothetical protein